MHGFLPSGPTKTLAEDVMNHVHRAVVTGELETGKLYSVYQLAEQLGISRSPVRDGLLRLEEAGLIEFSRNRGFRIVPTSHTDVAEIFSIRMALEIPAAHRAALSDGPRLADQLEAIEDQMVRAAENDDVAEFFRLDQELHDLILVAARCSRSRQIIARLRISTQLLGISTAGKERTLSDIIAEHSPIIESIRSGNPEDAASAMHEHLSSTGRLLVAQAATQQQISIDADQLWDELTAGY